MIQKCYLTITKACNMQCVYCIQGQEKPSDTLLEVDPDIVKRYFDPSKKLSICFYGGEPLIKIDYIHRLGHALKEYNSNISLAVITNGRLLDKKAVKILNDIDCHVTVSHDGKHYEKTRLMPDFLKTNPEPYLALKKKSISATVSRINYDFYDVWNYFDEFSLKHDIERQNVRINLVRDAGGFTPEQLLIKDMLEFEQMLDRVIANMECNVLKNNLDCHEYQHFLPMITTLDFRLKHKGVCAYCGADSFVAHMDVLGNLYPCHNLDKPNGNIADEPFRAGNYNPNINTAKCKACEAYIYCGGGCVAIPKERKEYDCYVIKQQFNKLVASLHRLGEHLCKK